MTISQSIGDDVCHKLRGVGLPKEVVLPLVDLLTRQVQAEGPENVVKRLKTLKQAAIYYMAGEDPVFDWIAHTPQGPKGPWKPVWKMLTQSSYKHKKRALNAMMVYASFVLPKSAGPTQAQERKFLGSVEQGDRASATAFPDLLKPPAVGARGVTILERYLRYRGWSPTVDPDYPDILGYTAQHYGVQPQSRKGKGPKYPRAVRLSETAIETHLGTDAGRPFHAFPQIKAVLGDVGIDYFELTHPWNGSYWDWRESKPPTEPIGVVGYSHEPGLKFRAFAAPSVVLQAALEPMKRDLLRALTLVPWDCTHNQDRGVAEVQKWLSLGKTVYSVDLSDATNNFPLELQLKVLHSLGVSEQDIRLMWMVARSPFTKVWGDKAAIRWNVGQPLGAGPSFPMFALAHAAIAIESEYAAGIRGDVGSSFRILGDDFVCCHPEVHKEYRKRLALLGCPISESKCLQSELAGEFAGKFITHNYVYHGYKYRAMSDRSFMDQVRTLGSQAISPVFLTKRQLEYCQLVKNLPEPFGLGFNPQGIPFEQRYEDYLHIKEALDRHKRPPEHASLAQLRNRLVYQFAHRHWSYLEIDPQHKWVEKTPPVRRKVDPNVIDERVTGRVSVVSPQKGDPRPNPIQDWTGRVEKEIIPILQKQVALRQESKPEGEHPQDMTPSPPDAPTTESRKDLDAGVLRKQSESEEGSADVSSHAYLTACLTGTGKETKGLDM